MRTRLAIVGIVVGLGAHAAYAQSARSGLSGLDAFATRSTSQSARWIDPIRVLDDSVSMLRSQSQSGLYAGMHIIIPTAR